MSEEKKPSTGPYVVGQNGEKSDRNFWKANMDPEAEAKFDKYMKVKGISKAAKKELAKRDTKKIQESLMEAFK